jgi:hypothetical protein
LRVVYATGAPACCTRTVVTVYGVLAVSFMMTIYALESRDDHHILGFTPWLSRVSSYGFLSGA